MTTTKYYLYRFSQTSADLTAQHRFAHFRVADRESFLVLALDAFVSPCNFNFRGNKRKVRGWLKNVNDEIRLQCYHNDRNYETLLRFPSRATVTEVGETIEDRLGELFPRGEPFEICDECGLSISDGFHIYNCKLGNE